MTSTPVRSNAAAVKPAVRAAIDRIGPGVYGVACSGGADSMALAHAAVEVAGAPHVVVLIVDHGLSPGSGEVAARVAAWARGQGAAAIVRGVAVPRRASVEASAREARYAALAALADELGLAAILVGHTARDQAETVLMRVVRGTGPAGLAGIPAVRGRIVRPLLGVAREATEAYAAEQGLPIIDDPMNADAQLARVRFRERVMPALREENPQLDAALVRLAASAQEWLEVIDSLAAPFVREQDEKRDRPRFGSASALAKQPPAIRKRAVALLLEDAGLGYDATHLDAIDELVTRPASGRVALDVPGGRVVRTYDLLRVEPAPGPGPLSTSSTSSATPAPLVAPEGPYVVRVWQAGDRMRPSRLKGRSRKLSDLYADAKVPRELREHARVVVRTTDQGIVWAEHVGLAHGETSEVMPKPARTVGSF
ncbi:MAG TPA: tRNA lysidine(34) synthetase TilS [Kofleriaceae bacterium]|jgi:tRNA(Ile)-lysidine synthase|nr:tRNA lysidine(34) synthetase TilS [Kofleriaceae bacterium]